ncbi:MAG: lipase maturation factor family protein [Polyangiales bacterium]
MREPTRHSLVRFLFLRSLGVVAACAFASVAAQIDALLGTRGIEPAVELAHQINDRAKRDHLSLFWLHPTDGMLHGLVWAGVLASLLLVVDVAPALGLFVAWACYASLVVVGSVFFSYQWDALLLESFLVAAFVVPWRLQPRWDDPPPHRFGIWIVRALVFKLMFLSGLVKLGSGDPTWRNLTALDYHYWTQPLPAATSFFVARLPRWMHKASTLVTFVIELGAPFLVFGPRRLRWLACALFVILQLGIAFTGNYGFFNVLTIVLCISLLDDDAIESRVRIPLTPSESRRSYALGWALGSLVLLVSVIESCTRVAPAGTVPKPAIALADRVETYLPVHSYGLFAVMTTARPEIEIEGSADGVTWKPYVFRYKAAIDRRPRFVPLHMPRLDWQMWFAALAGNCDNVFWYPDFLKRVLEGSKDVNAAFESVPFPSKPPLFLRSTLWDYRLGEKGWIRNDPRPFCPIVTLQGGQLLRADE